MKTFIFIFYYVNIEGMTRRSAQTVFESLMERTNLSKFNNNELEIIQQYFPVTNGNSRVELHHIPNKVITTDSKETKRINNAINILNENIKNLMPIQNISELYE